MPTPRESLAPAATAIGVITPSGNDVVERTTIAICAALPGVSVHFSRTPVFGDRDPYPATYDWDGMLGAAKLLAHVDPAVIVWNGSKAAAIDIALDHELVAAHRRRDRPPGDDLHSCARRSAPRRRHSPHRRDQPLRRRLRRQGRRTLAKAGYEIVASKHRGLADNLSFSRIPARRDRGDGATGGRIAPAGDRRRVHQLPRRGGRGGNRSRARHPGLRHGRAGRVGVAARRGRRYAAGRAPGAGCSSAHEHARDPRRARPHPRRRRTASGRAPTS